MKVEIIDLRTQINRERYDLQHGMAIKVRFHKFASAHSEVLLVGRVPPECLTLTWRVVYSDEGSSDYELIHIYVINMFLANRVVNWEKKDNSVLI